MLHALGMLQSSTAKEPMVIDNVPISRFGAKVGVLTKTDAFAVFNKYSTRDPESGCSELDAEAFTAGVDMMLKILKARLALSSSIRPAQPAAAAPPGDKGVSQDTPVPPLSLPAAVTAVTAAPRASGAQTQRTPRKGEGDEAAGKSRQAVPSDHDAPQTARADLGSRAARGDGGGRQGRVRKGAGGGAGGGGGLMKLERLSTWRTQRMDRRSRFLLRVQADLGLSPKARHAAVVRLPQLAPAADAATAHGERGREEHGGRPDRARKAQADVAREKDLMFDVAQSAAGSLNESIQRCAAPAVTALAVRYGYSATENGGVMESLMHLFASNPSWQVCGLRARVAAGVTGLRGWGACLMACPACFR